MIKLFDNKRSQFDEEYLNKAKEKAQFMSCFLAIRKEFSKTTCVIDYNKCKLPVLFDATCSGMQHLSALMTDIDLASLVNLTGGDLKDFYSHCAEIVSAVIAKLPHKGIKKKLLNIKIERQLIKIPVMTIPYNIGLEGLTEKITDKFDKYIEEIDGAKKLRFLVPGTLTVDGQPMTITGQEAGKLGSVIYHTVKGLIPPIQILKDYFTGILKIMSRVNKPIFWITPAGMKIYGSTLASTSKRIKTSFLKNAKPVTIRIPTDNYDYKTINRSLMANLIHSMDAANIHYLIKIILSGEDSEYKNINLYTIHDCFASMNNQMDIIEKLVRKAFSSLYFDNNYLKNLDTSLLNQITSCGITIEILDNGVRRACITSDESKPEIEYIEIPELPTTS